MGNIAVVYCSEYGSTKAYAAYIAEKLGADLLQTAEAKDISSYTMVIFGGGLYAGALNGSEWLKEKESELAEKKLILFSCGLFDPKDKENRSHIRRELEKSLPPALFAQAELVCLRGNLDYKHLKFSHKGMMMVLMQYLKRKKERTATDAEILAGKDKKLEYIDLSTADRVVNLARG